MENFKCLSIKTVAAAATTTTTIKILCSHSSVAEDTSFLVCTAVPLGM
jgi:hypothetical protein